MRTLFEKDIQSGRGFRLMLESDIMDNDVSTCVVSIKGKHLMGGVYLTYIPRGKGVDESPLVLLDMFKSAAQCFAQRLHAGTIKLMQPSSSDQQNNPTWRDDTSHVWGRYATDNKFIDLALDVSVSSDEGLAYDHQYATDLVYAAMRYVSFLLDCDQSELDLFTAQQEDETLKTLNEELSHIEEAINVVTLGAGRVRLGIEDDYLNVLFQTPNEANGLSFNIKDVLVKNGDHLDELVVTKAILRTVTDNISRTEGN